MGWLKDILQENRRVVNSWPEWKRRARMSDEMPEAETLVAEVGRLEAENAQLKSSVSELEENLEKYAWSYSPAMAEAKIDQLNKEVDQLKAELVQCQQDLKDAAGELVVPMPEPGTDMAKLLSANVILRQREERLRKVLTELYAQLQGLSIRRAPEKVG